MPVQRLTVSHRTVYHYRRPVAFGPHRLMFRPRDSHDLRLIDTHLTLSPPGDVRWFHDVLNNSVATVSFGQPAQKLLLESKIVLDRYSLNTPEFPIDPRARTLPFSYGVSEIPDLGRTIERHYPDPENRVAEWAAQFMGGSGPADTEAFLIALTRGIREQLKYEERHEPGVRDPVETIGNGAGTCRDYAVLMMEAVRSVGLAARFVSGYLYDPSIDDLEGDTVGAGSTHAWAQVYLPGAGWLEFDPTNGAHGGVNLIPIAVAREPGQAIPVSGSYEGDPDDFLRMEVDVSVTAHGTPIPLARNHAREISEPVTP